MLDIEPKFVRGTGIFDVAKKIIQKTSNSAIGQKVLNSATTKNLKRAADSAIGQEIKKSVLTGVSKASKNAAESAFEKLGLPPASERKRRRKQKEKSGKGIVLD